MIAVVVPAANEAQRLPRALEALRVAARHPSLRSERVLLVVVLDGCTDDSAAVAERHGAITVATPGGNVGRARAAGAEFALQRGARWLAFTDADSWVAPDWLAVQIALDCDAVCGTVTVHDWDEHDDAVRRRHEQAYLDADGHRHVHGANLGVSAAAYRRCGGFAPLATGEDVALVRAIEQHRLSIAWSAWPRVATSARRDHRAPDGFGAFLGALAADPGPMQGGARAAA